MPPTAANPSVYGVVLALGEAALFGPGESVRVSDREPIGHYRVPRYLRGKVGTVERAIQPTAVDNEEEGYGRDAGSRLHYYRVAFAMKDVWPGYAGPAGDGLHIEVFESWLERV